MGSLIASALPCVLAMVDIRKTPEQVLVAFLSQIVVHFFIDFMVEPIFFGMSVEINSVIVILGIWFFFQVWGVAGMVIAVPLLGVGRLALKSMKRKKNRTGGQESETIV